jgi:hypothetical protein
MFVEWRATIVSRDTLRIVPELSSYLENSKACFSINLGYQTIFDVLDIIVS